MSDTAPRLAPLRAQYRANTFVGLGIGLSGLVVLILLGVEFWRAIVSFMIALVVIVLLLGSLAFVPRFTRPDELGIKVAPPKASQASVQDVNFSVIKRVVLFLPFVVLANLLLGSAGFGGIAALGLVFLIMYFKLTRWEQKNGVLVMYVIGKIPRKGELYGVERLNNLE